MIIDTDTYEQIGRNDMAEALLDLLSGLHADADGQAYIDGVQDALNTLVQSGAADPREAS